MTNLGEHRISRESTEYSAESTEYPEKNNKYLGKNTEHTTDMKYSVQFRGRNVSTANLLHKYRLHAHRIHSQLQC